MMCLIIINSDCIYETKSFTQLRPGTHYRHVTWAHVMLRVQLGCERRFNTELYGVGSRFCHVPYVTWSHVEIWSAHVTARLSPFCCRTHFVRRELREESSSDIVTSCFQNWRICLLKKCANGPFHDTKSPDYRAYQHIDVMHPHFSPDSHCVGG
jgi:hypothetical protein